VEAERPAGVTTFGRVDAARRTGGPDLVAGSSGRI